MADLAERVRGIIGDDPNVGEVRMMGGICFMLNGNMLVCTMRDGGLLVRVGEDGRGAALERPGTSTMALTGRDMKAYVLVSPETLGGASLKQWIATATAFVSAMPPKQKKPPAPRRKPAK
ncbi:MAG: TfoX/Sxy family protein [Rhizobiaceae bacterium]|nr:TfoX/Sxy family protein [Rhizobiaceae bacterium]